MAVAAAEGGCPAYSTDSLIHVLSLQFLQTGVTAVNSNYSLFIFDLRLAILLG